MRVGVSPETLLQSATWRGPHIPASIELVPITGEAAPSGVSGVSALWRRQHDRTAWVRAAIEKAPLLSWLHTDTVGIDRLPLDILQARNVIVSNAHGVFADAMAEFALCAMLVISKQIACVSDSQRAARWAVVTPRKLLGASVMVLGGGAAAQALIPRCLALGMTACCVSRTGRWAVQSPQPGLRLFAADENWRAELSSIDFLIVVLPLTPVTRRMVDSSVLDRLQRGASVINLGRAETVDRTALIAALRSGHVANAWLDVHDPEPLPAGDPIWIEPGLFISPHMSALSSDNERACRSLFLEQAVAILGGRRPTCTVDLVRGY